MKTLIREQQIKDADLLTEGEMGSSDKSTKVSSLFPVPILSTVAATSSVTLGVSVESLNISAGDVAVITGGAASGEYTIATVNGLEMTVEGVLPNSSGVGTLEVYHPPGATKVGVNNTPFTSLPKTALSLQGTLEDIDTYLGSLIGEDCVTGSSTGPSTTTGTSFLTKVSQNLTVTKNANYLIGWSFLWSYDASTTDFRAQVTLASATIWEMRQEPQDTAGSQAGGILTDQRHPAAGFHILSLSPGVYNLQLQWASGSNGTQAAIQNAQLFAFRVNP